MGIKNVQVILDPQVEEYILDRWPDLTPTQQQALTAAIQRLETDPGDGLGPPLPVSTHYYEHPIGHGMCVCLYYEPKVYPTRTEMVVRYASITVANRPKTAL